MYLIRLIYSFPIRTVTHNMWAYLVYLLNETSCFKVYKFSELRLILFTCVDTNECVIASYDMFVVLLWCWIVIKGSFDEAPIDRLGSRDFIYRIALSNGWLLAVCVHLPVYISPFPCASFKRFLVQGALSHFPIQVGQTEVCHGWNEFLSLL
jgi:hypothetical protein